MKKYFTLIAAMAIACGMTALAGSPMLTATLSTDEVNAGEEFDLMVEFNMEGGPNAMQMSVTSDSEIFAAKGAINSSAPVSSTFVEASHNRNFFLANSMTAETLYPADGGPYGVTFHYVVNPDTPVGNYLLRVSDVVVAYSTPSGVVTCEPNDARVIIKVAPYSGVEDVKVDETIEVKVADPEGWYNLQGIRYAEPTTPGLYIHNGKKIIVK